MFSILLSTCLGVELLDHMITLQIAKQRQQQKLKQHEFKHQHFKIFLVQNSFFSSFLSCEIKYQVQFSSVQFSRSVVSDSLQPHELQHARPPCPSSTPGVHSDSRPSSKWCHPAISSSVVPFSSCSQSLPSSESFAMTQLFAWGG